MRELLKSSVIVLLIGLGLESCRCGHDDARTGPSAPIRTVEKPRRDLSAFVRKGPTEDPTVRRSFHGRPFYFTPLRGIAAGVPNYSLQIGGDGLVMSVGCPEARGSLSFEGDVVHVCGDEYRLEITEVPNRYILNGVTIDLRSGCSNCHYMLLPSGNYLLSVG